MMNEYPLTDEQIRFYRKNGFVQLPGVLTPEELEAARAHLAEAMALKPAGALDRTGMRSDYDRVFLQKVNLWRDHEGIRKLVFSPRLAEIARRLAGAERVRLWH